MNNILQNYHTLHTIICIIYMYLYTLIIFWGKVSYDCLRGLLFSFREGNLI